MNENIPYCAFFLKTKFFNVFLLTKLIFFFFFQVLLTSARILRQTINRDHVKRKFLYEKKKKNWESFAMETCVLIPQELSLAIIPSDRERDRNKQSKEINVTVFSNVCVQQGTFLYPFQGTIRLDKIEVTSYLDDNDVSHLFNFFKNVSYVKFRSDFGFILISWSSPLIEMRTDGNLIGRHYGRESLV